MKRLVLGVANALLGPVGAELVRRDALHRNDARAVLARFARKSMEIGTVVDIGASDGKWSIEHMSVFPESCFLAVEPLQERLSALRELARKHERFDYALCVAGAEDGGTATLTVTPDLDGTTVDGSTAGTRRDSTVRTIDALLAEKDLPGPYFLKFDTHGYELPILAGCKRALAHTAAVFMEAYNFELTPGSLRFHEMISHMEGLGFRVADIAEPIVRPRDEIFWQCDLLFLRSDAPQYKYPHYR